MLQLLKRSVSNLKYVKKMPGCTDKALGCNCLSSLLEDSLHKDNFLKHHTFSEETKGNKSKSHTMTFSARI